MYRVYRITCNTDWKGRAEHILTSIGTFPVLESAIECLDNDVEKCKKEDIENDNMVALEEAAEEGIDPPEPITEWENSERFEMQRTKNDTTRVICHNMGGDFASISWRIVEEGS